MSKQGFTFIELLTVIAIMGIVAGLFSWNLITGVRKAELREATNQIAADFRRARSTAQKGSADVSIEWSPDESGKITSYSVAGKSRSIDHDISIICKSGCNGTSSVTYQAPYGELGATGMVFTVNSPKNIPTMEIRIVGVTGKVIVAGGS